ncbi:fatty acid desaturase 4, partial [Quercus suber]
NLVSKVYHWVIDNYGSASTPIFGAQIDAFHSEQPWAITWRQLAKNLHTLARAVTFTMLLMDLAINDLIFHAFVAVWSGCLLFSQQFHVSAHMTKSRLPPLVIGLQDMELLVSHSQHANHNRPPYNNNYCIVSAVWNEYLDKRQISKALEVILFCKLGVHAAESHIWFRPILAALAGYILADLGSGVYYWGIYNYGSISTPIFGAQISGCILFSQHFHVWAHTTKSRLPPLVIALQDMGLLLSCQYVDHHRPPYNNNYCIVSGLWNKFLDKQHVFKALETTLFFKLGNDHTITMFVIIARSK